MVEYEVCVFGVGVGLVVSELFKYETPGTKMDGVGTCVYVITICVPKISLMGPKGSRYVPREGKPTVPGLDTTYVDEFGSVRVVGLGQSVY